jgi:hypothetical protein
MRNQEERVVGSMEARNTEREKRASVNTKTEGKNGSNDE